MSSLVYLLVWSPPPYIPYISSPNQCLLFATHAHTISTCFDLFCCSTKIRPISSTVFLVALSTLLGILSFFECQKLLKRALFDKFLQQNKMVQFFYSHCTVVCANMIYLLVIQLLLSGCPPDTQSTILNKGYTCYTQHHILSQTMMQLHSRQIQLCRRVNQANVYSNRCRLPKIKIYSINFPDAVTLCPAYDRGSVSPVGLQDHASCCSRQ